MSAPPPPPGSQATSTATSAEDVALLQEIARLTGQISHAKSSLATSSGYHSTVAPSSYQRGKRGGYPSRGGRGAYSSPSASSSSSLNGGAISRHRKLVLNEASTPSGVGNSSHTSPGTSGPAPIPHSSSGASRLGDNGSIMTMNGEPSTGPSLPSAQPSGSGWVKRKTTHNMSLVSTDTFEKTEAARLASLKASREAKEAAKTSKQSSSSSPSASASASTSGKKAATPSVRGGKAKGSSAAVRRGDNMGEVIIDGVVFVFDETGTKLLKKVQSTTQENDAPSSTPVGQKTKGANTSPSKAPLRTSVNGQAFVRTKRGNLISAELLEKRKSQKESAAKLKRMASLGRQIGDIERVRSSGRKSRNKTLSTAERRPKGLCSFFTKTGQCKRGLSCPYEHDATKLAICPGALRPAGCAQPAGLCPLSHSLTSPQRLPHCVHFLRSLGKSCRNGQECRYLHPALGATLETLHKEDCGICMDFSKFGWCDNGRLCKLRHTFDCSEFLERGSCERKGCRLQHSEVARRIYLLNHPNRPTGEGAEKEEEQEEARQVRGESESTAQYLTDLTGGMGDDQGGKSYSDSSSIIQRGKRKRHTNTSTSKSKRKSLLSKGFVASSEEEEEEEEKVGEEDEGVSFLGPTTSRGGRGRGRGGKKARRDFLEQRDFISFDDEEEEEESEGEDEDEEEGEMKDVQDGTMRGILEGSEVESVSSEEEEGSDEEGSSGRYSNSNSNSRSGSGSGSGSGGGGGGGGESSDSESTEESESEGTSSSSSSSSSSEED